MGTRPTLREIVVGVDGSEASDAALRWAADHVAPGGRVHAVHVVGYVDELAVDAALGDSVAMRHRRDRELAARTDETLAGLDRDVEWGTEVREGAVAATLTDVGRQRDADAIAVGHHPSPRFGARVVGHVTADLIAHSDRPTIVVPAAWRDDVGGSPVVVGVGVTAATRAALRWGLDRAADEQTGIVLVHALGPRSLFRPDGALDVLGYYLDPAVVTRWVEEDVEEVAQQISAEAGADVEMTISIAPGRIGRRLLDAGDRARLLVVGLGGAPFRRHAMARSLRTVVAGAVCPVAIVPRPES